jgi:hypothetical protein
MASIVARSSPRAGGAASNAPMIWWRRLAHRSWRRFVVVLMAHVLVRGDDHYADPDCRDTRIFCGSPLTLT